MGNGRKLKTAMKTYTIEAYQYNTDKKIKIRVLVGTIDSVRDCLSPCMRFVEEVRAHNKRTVEQQARTRAKKEGFQFIR